MDRSHMSTTFERKHLAMKPSNAPHSTHRAGPRESQALNHQFQQSFATSESGTTCDSMNLQSHTHDPHSTLNWGRDVRKTEAQALSPDLNNNDELGVTSSEESDSVGFQNSEPQVVVERPTSRKIIRGIRPMQNARSQLERQNLNSTVNFRMPCRTERDGGNASLNKRRLGAETSLTLLPEENFVTAGEWKDSELSVCSVESADRASDTLILVDNATRSMSRLLNNLKRLWLNVRESGTLPLLSFTAEHRLLQLTSLCSFVVHEMETEWNAALATPFNKEHLARVEEMNRMLQEQVEHSREFEGSLQSEISYMHKEKVLMAEEIRELSMQVAELKLKWSNTDMDPPQCTTYTQLAHHNAQYPDSCSRDTQNVELDDGEETNDRVIEDSLDEQSLIRKRENEFDSILEFVENRGSDMSYYQSQLDTYDQDISALQTQLVHISAHNLELERVNQELSEKEAILIRERNHYESVLKLILQEKQSDGVSLLHLLQTLISKLTQPRSNNAIPVMECSLLESAILAVQEQNYNYREQIRKLKAEVKGNEEQMCALNAEWEKSTCQFNQQIEQLIQVLTQKNEEIRQWEKYIPLEEANVALTQSKVRLEKALFEKEAELKGVQDGVHTLEKTNLRGLKKCHEWQRLNFRLHREIQEHKSNMESLNKIVVQMRESVKEQELQWRERLRADGEEVRQTKEQSKWFQTQVENMNGQLTDAHERMKEHERDKFSLVQQVLAAQEERKLVDRKLMELRGALQGDTVLREALMERNEALQIEINRLRKAKLLSLGRCGLSEDGELYSNPPSEMSTFNTLASLNALPPSEKLGLKKNRYTAAYAAGQRREDMPRTVASMHASTGTNHRNGK